MEHLTHSHNLSSGLTPVLAEPPDFWSSMSPSSGGEESVLGKRCPFSSANPSFKQGEPKAWGQKLWWVLSCPQSCMAIVVM